MSLEKKKQNQGEWSIDKAQDKEWKMFSYHKREKRTFVYLLWLDESWPILPVNK